MEYRQMMDDSMARMYKKWPVIKPMEIVPTTMGDRIRARRDKMKISRVDLSLIIGADEKTIMRWESNEIVPSLSRTCTVADALETTPDYLLGCPLESMYRHMGDRIKHMREDCGLSLESLAKTLGYGRNRQTDIERGKVKPKDHELPRMAEALETTVAWLKGEE